jgi:hypothetical protein
MSGRVFESMDSRKIARLVASATRRIVLAMPGISDEVAKALIAARSRPSPPRITVIIDCDETVCRLGFGSISAVQQLHQAEVQVQQCSGMRLGLFICDDRAWTFAPTALYVQDEVHSDETPNAITFGGAEADRLARSASAEEEAVSIPPRSEEQNQTLPFENCEPQKDQQENVQPIEPPAIGVEIGLHPVSSKTVLDVASNLEQVPPLPFDVARQVRVFEPYIQSVSIQLDGCALTRRRVNIPKSIVHVGAAKDIKERLSTIFDLIDRTSDLSSRALEAELAELRKNYTRHLGKKWGRVMMRGKRPEFDAIVAQIAVKVKAHKQNVLKGLRKQLERSCNQIVAYYLPQLVESPPPELSGQLTRPKPTKKQAEQWLRRELASVIPAAETLVREMELLVRYRDVTYEDLSDPKFQAALREEFPMVEWDKPYNEFDAAKARTPAKV